MDFLRNKIKKFWFLILFAIFGGGFALSAVIPEVTTIPIESGKNTIQSSRVVDFRESGNDIHFAYYTDVVPPLQEGEDITLRRNNSWTKVSGMSQDDLVLGTYFEGEERFRQEDTFGSQAMWVWVHGDRNNPSNWRVVDYATSTKKDFDKTNARERVIQHRLTGQSAFIHNEPWYSVIFGRYAFAEDFFPQAGAGGGNVTVDGYIERSVTNDSWAQIQGGAGNGGAGSDGNSPMFTRSQEVAGENRYSIMRTFNFYKTDSIPAANTISSASLFISPSGITTEDGVDGLDYITVVQAKGQFITDNDLVNDDYVECGDAIDNPTEAIDPGDRIDMSDMTTGTYTEEFVFNSTGISWIARSGETTPAGATEGITYLCLREGHDAEDISIADNSDNLLQLVSADGAAGDRPKLVVTHSAVVAEGFYEIYR